jgi:hypothetical protein
MADKEDKMTTTSEKTRRQITSPWNAGFSQSEPVIRKCYAYRISWTSLRMQSKVNLLLLGHQVDSQSWAMMAGLLDKGALVVLYGRGRQQGGKGKGR